jgi:uncharacterized membrane protein
MDIAAFITSAFCHTQPERTFVVNGHALPLCARCTGVYVGIVIAFAWALATPLRRAAAMPRRALWICIAIIVLFAVLGFGRLYDMVDLRLGARTAAGLYFGATLGVMIWPVIANWIGGASLYAWRRPQWLSFLLLLALLPAIVLAIAARIPMIHYITGLVSLIGLVGSWVTANTLVLLWISRLNRRWSLLSRALIAIVAVGCFAAEIGLLRWWRSVWSV